MKKSSERAVRMGAKIKSWQARAGPVRITRPDGTVEVRPAYSFQELSHKNLHKHPRTPGSNGA